MLNLTKILEFPSIKFLMITSIFLSASIWIAEPGCCADEHGSDKIPADLEGFFSSLEDQIADLHRFLLRSENSDAIGSELFKLLDRAIDPQNRFVPEKLNPIITASAILTINGEWLAWAGNPGDIMPDWIAHTSDCQPGVVSVFLLETPGNISTIHLTRGQNRIFMSQCTLISRTLGDAKSEDVRIRFRDKDIVCRYRSPFQHLPGEKFLKSGLQDPDFKSLLTTIEIRDHSMNRWQEMILFRWALKLSDPRFYSGNLLGIRSALPIMILGILMWIFTTFLKVRPVGKLFGRIAGFLLLIVLIFFVFLVSRLTETFISDTSSSWWPDFIGENGYLSLVLPLAALLIIGSWIRLLLWLGSATFMQNSDFLKRHSGKRIPGWLCQTVAVSVLTPFLILNANNTVRQNITTRLQNWTSNRENLIPLAIDANLKSLSEKARGLFADPRIDNGFPALELWRQSDLHAINAEFGVQILEADGQVFDRFSPYINLNNLHVDVFTQTRSSPDSHLIIPSRLQRDDLHSSTIGISAIDPDSESSEFLMIQIPSGLNSIKPLSGQWGDEVDLYIARTSTRLDWPTDCPLSYPIEWYGEPSDPPRWKVDPSGRFHLLLFPVSASGSALPEVIVCLLPINSLISQSAGTARLTLLAMSILIPGLVYREFRRIIKNRFLKTYGSFTRQLLGAFLLPVIILPLAFAVSVHRVIVESGNEHLAVQMRHLFQQNLTELSQTVFDQAIAIQVRVEQELLCAQNIVDQSAFPWMVLDNFGREIMSGLLENELDVPLATVSKVYQNRHIRTSMSREVIFRLTDAGMLKLQVVLPFPHSREIEDEKQLSGTFICELPVTGELVQAIQNPDGTSLDLYSQGSIVASNRPELFNTGFLCSKLSPYLYRRLFLEGLESIIEINRIGNIFSMTGTIMSDTGQPAAALAISVKNPPFSTPPVRAQEWFILATAILLISGVIFSMFFGNRIAQPIRHLTDGALRLASGDFSTKVPEAGAGETRLLSRTFNAMIADLEQQRSRLQDRHAFISTVLARMSSAILATDENGMIVTMNQAFAGQFGLKETDYLHHPVESLLEAIDSPELSEAFRERFSGIGGERRLIRLLKFGRTVHLAIGFANLESFGRERGLLIVLDDVTGTIQSSKLQAYTDLARRIAHEIKNPLTPIQLAIEHLREAWDDGAPDFPDIFNKCVKMVLDEVQSLERISSEFSRFARFPKPAFRIMDLRELIGEIVLLYPAPPDGIRINIEIPEQELLCRLDRDQMKRVLINLVQNALQAMDAGGVVTIRGKRADPWIVLEIGDTGRGMDRETLLHLFEPYFSTKREGSGLGLVITKAVIDAHDGDIQVSSAPGTGTVFTIRLARMEHGDMDGDDGNERDSTDAG